jgi:hypothetical protein
MPMISTLNNATNASFVLKYGNYTDFNIWVMVFAIMIILVIASRYINSRDDVGRLLIATLAVIFGLAAVYGSLGVAHFDYAQGATLISNNSTVNESITYNYVYPVQQVIANQWITAISIVMMIFAILNAIDIFIVMLERPNVDDMKKKGGRGIRI